MTTFIVLLRAVNVGGHNRVSMPKLKAGLTKAGYQGVRTYINSGNVVLQGTGPAAAVEREVEALLAKRFKVEVPVLVRTAEQWAKHAAANPFPDAPGNILYLGLSKSKPKSDAMPSLQKYAAPDDRLKVVGEGLWIAFSTGAGKSKVTPTVLDKAMGSPVTMRNWNTVQKLDEMGREGP